MGQTRTTENALAWAVAMPRKKTAAQLNREIAEVLATPAGGSNPFEGAKAEGALLEREVDAADVVLKTFPRGAMGIVSDAVASSPEYRAAKARINKAFAALRAFNAVFTKSFAKELRAERSKRYGG